MQFHVTCALEFLKDHFVHSGAGVDECSGDDGQTPTFFDVASCSKEALRLVEGIGIYPTGKDFT